MKIPVIPDWCKGLPDSTILFSADIFEFFGYECKMSNCHVYIRDNLLPEPKESTATSTGTKRARKYYWLLGGVRKLRIDMLKDQDND